MKLDYIEIVMHVSAASMGKLLSVLNNKEKIMSLFDKEKISEFRKKLKNEEELMTYLKEALILYKFPQKDINLIHDIIARAGNDVIDAFIATKN